MIPRRDVILKVGFRLRYGGIQAHPVESYHLYKHTAGLEVHASEENGALHVTVSHRKRDPTEEEVELVRLAFFRVPSEVSRFCPQETVSAGLINMAFAAVGHPTPAHTFKIWHLREPKRTN